MRRHLYVVSVILTIIFLLTSCVKPVPPIKNTVLKGVVMTDGEHGGVVRLLSKSGNLIGEADIYRLGGFLYRSDNPLPESFLIEADVTFKGLDLTYSYEMSDPGPDGIIYIGPVSTLIHEYHLKYPEKSLNAVREKVLIFLAIEPDHSDYKISMNPRRFSVSNFVSNALTHGSFAAYVDFLVEDLSKGGGPHDFGEGIKDPEASLFETLIGQLKENLEGAAIDYATGWVFDMIGGGNGGNPEADIEKLLELQLAMLQNIETEIEQLQQELKEAVNELINATDRSTYNTAVTVIADEVGTIEAKYQQLAYYATLDPDQKNKENIQNLSTQIKDEVPNSFMTIRDVLQGRAGSEGVLSLWSRIAFKDAATISDYVAMISSQFSYYFGLQLKAINLMVEVYHAEDPANIKMATNYFNGWMDDLRDQLVTFDSFNPISELATSTKFPMINTVLSWHAWPAVSSMFLVGDRVIVTDGGWEGIPTEDPNIEVYSVDSKTLQDRLKYSQISYSYRATAVDSTYLYLLYHLQNNNYRLYRTKTEDSQEDWIYSDFTLDHGCLQMMANDHWIFILGGGNNGFYLNIRNRISLDHVKTIQLTGSSGNYSQTVAMTSDGDYAYFVASNGNTLSSFDLNTLEIIDTINFESKIANFPNMTVRDDILCVSSGSQDIFFVDISDKSNLNVFKTIVFDPNQNNGYSPLNANFAGNFVYTTGSETFGNFNLCTVYDNPKNLTGPMFKEGPWAQSLLNWQPILMNGENELYIMGTQNELQLWRKHVVVDIPLY